MVLKVVARLIGPSVHRQAITWVGGMGATRNCAAIGERRKAGRKEAVFAKCTGGIDKKKRAILLHLPLSYCLKVKASTCLHESHLRTLGTSSHLSLDDSIHVTFYDDDDERHAKRHFNFFAKNFFFTLPTLEGRMGGEAAVDRPSTAAMCSHTGRHGGIGGCRH